MINFKKLGKEINQSIQNYWPDFKLLAYAVYDMENVYLYNHPEYPSSEKTYHAIPWNEHFNGADTLISYKDYPTAIVNLDLHPDFEALYPIVIHELFHGNQYIQGEKRFPNESLGMTYPFTEENIELRNKERDCLYQAIFSPSRKDKQENLRQFILYREGRRALIGEHLEYETAIETVEGPAFYVELHAYMHIHSATENVAWSQYGDGLLDKKDSTMHLRKSCYSSGLFICLLLDEFYPNWKENLFSTEQSVYDMLKAVVQMEPKPISHIEISEETISLIHLVKENSKKQFEQFEQQEGHSIYIVGHIVSKGYDPMNIVADEDKLLHKNFLVVSINNKEYQISQPVIAHYTDHYRTIHKLHLVLDEKPLNHSGLINIKGIGQIQGDFQEKSTGAILLLPNH